MFIWIEMMMTMIMWLFTGIIIIIIINLKSSTPSATRISRFPSREQRTCMRSENSANLNAGTVALIHELLPVVTSCCFTLIHSIPSTASSPSSHQPAWWQIRLADARYPAASHGAKCRRSKIWACLCLFNFALGLPKCCQAQAIWLSAVLARLRLRDE